MYDQYGRRDDHPDFGNEPPVGPPAGSLAGPVRRTDKRQEVSGRPAEAAGADTLSRVEAEALQKAAAAEARCQFMEEMLASGGFHPAGFAANHTQQPGKA